MPFPYLISVSNSKNSSPQQLHSVTHPKLFFSSPAGDKVHAITTVQLPALKWSESHSNRGKQGKLRHDRPSFLPSSHMINDISRGVDGQIRQTDREDDSDHTQLLQKSTDLGHRIPQVCVQALLRQFERCGVEKCFRSLFWGGSGLFWRPILCEPRQTSLCRADYSNVPGGRWSGEEQHPPDSP